MKNNKIIQFLASLKLAVILLLLLAAILATATFYESLYDAETAQHLVYHTWYFNAFLLLLGINVFCAAAVRYPWKKHQTGFVLTHAGILLILAGALITQLFGLDGSMPVREGTSSSLVYLNEPVLYLTYHGGHQTTIPVEFRWNPPRPGHSYQIKIDQKYTLVIDRYLHHAIQQISYEETERSEYGSVLQLRLRNSKVDTSPYLIPNRPTQLGPATVEFIELTTEDALTAFLQKGISSRGELFLLIEDRPFTIPVDSLPLKHSVQIGDTPYKVKLLKYFSHAVVRDNNLINLSSKPINPAIKVQFSDETGHQQTVLLFALIPDLNTVIEGDRSLPIRALYQNTNPDRPQRKLLIARGPQGNLYYHKDNGESGHINIGEERSTGWMDLKFSIQQYIPHAKMVTQYIPFKAPPGRKIKNPPPAAIRFKINSAHHSYGPYWVQAEDTLTVSPAEDLQNLKVRYGMKTVDIGLSIFLKDFNIDFDPGTRNPAAYKSVVEVDGQEKVIAMNQPLNYKGYKFFQSSYSTDSRGEPTISIFSVARDPGIGLKYTGSIVLIIGIIIMFYLRPLQIKHR